MVVAAVRPRIFQLPSDLQRDLPTFPWGGTVRLLWRSIAAAECVQGQQQVGGVPLQPLEGLHHSRGSCSQSFITQQPV